MSLLRFIIITVVLFNGLVSFAQEDSKETFFEVTFDAFTPPTKDMIRAFEGKEPMPFMASDIEGNEHYLKNYKGKVVFVYFWNGNCPDCIAQVSSLNLLHAEEKDRLQIVSFADESKAEATALAAANGIEFPVLTNGKLLGEAAYGIELGYPRLFAIDEDGKVVQVLPAEQLTGKADIYLQLKSLLNMISNK